MKIFNSVKEWKKELSQLKSEGLSLGFVPTMGALHEGHASLFKESLKDNDRTLVSIFLNPTQFDNREDLNNYPSSYEEDIKILEDLKVDYLFSPAYEELYRDNYRYSCRENKLSQILCGAARPGHFDGVLTVVMKLLNIGGAQKAYFGEKDYQQYLLIKEMAQTFFLETEIVPCPLIREKDGLALSSRNRRLSSEARQLAPTFYGLLNSGSSREKIKKDLSKAGFKVDYIEDYHMRRFGAVYLEEVRLIDNVPLR
ncbi:MAG: pantoate--beta-alanine ligase [Spirochaetales bacterium]|nr:pantoate--beta-alanine ligase [Spirochaetales bacterium]